MGSGIGLFLEADCGESGWVCAVTFVRGGASLIFSGISGLESSRSACTSSLEVSSVEACKEVKVSKLGHIDLVREI